MSTTQTEDFSYKLYSSSWYCKKNNIDYVGIVEHLITEHPDGTTTSKSNLHYAIDPIRPFFVTKPEFRDHDYKKEFEEINKCDIYRVHDSELTRTLASALGYRFNPKRTYINLKQLCNSPYVYCADVPSEVIVKQYYLKKTPVGKVIQLSKGGLDIETEVRDEERINVITFIHEHEVYTCALKEYCKIYKENSETEYHEANEKDCLKVIHDLLDPFLKEHNFNIHFHIEEDELELIKWIFDRIHECKTDYIGIWNMGFDIPKIIQRIKALNGNVEEILCHPEVPVDYRYVKWNEDSEKVDHFTDKWHWISIAGYSQFVDSMCLYARLRKVYGREPSYSLDAISNKELGTGKLHFGEITNHWYMQNFHFLEYIAYNINDVLIMEVMEWKNNDIDSLLGLSGKSLCQSFSHQTSMLRDSAYSYGLSRGKCVASAGTSMATDFDLMQEKVGGTVLPPNKAIGVGAKVVEEMPNQPTTVALFVNDLDFSQMYPSTMSMANISKETALLNTIKINGHSQEENEIFYAGVIRPSCNAVEAVHHFYGLADYEEIDKLFMKHMKNKERLSRSNI